VPDDHRIVAKDLANAAAGVEIVAAFEAADIPSILLKGPSFSTWLYPETERPAVDVDLLVPATRLADAEAILAARGFRHAPLDDLEGDKPWHAHEWVRARDGAIIDLHRTLLGLRRPPAEVWEVLEGRTEPLQLVRREVRILDEAARCLHVALHAAQGGTSTAKARRDLLRAVAVAPSAAWAEAADVAARLGGAASFAAGLRLAGGRGEEMARELGLPTRFDPETELRRRNASGEAVGLAWFLSLPSWAARGRWLRSKLFPPREFMSAWDERAEDGGLALWFAYPRRWVWLAARLPRAFRQWWSVR
jgi:hypothetical protein